MTNYSWTAVYSDETILPQFSEGQEFLFSDIDQSRLHAFVLSKQYGIEPVSNDIIVFLNGTILVKEVPILFHELGGRLVYFRRNKNNISSTGGPGSSSIKHVFGLQNTIQDKNLKLLFSLDDSTGEVGFIDH